MSKDPPTPPGTRPRKPRVLMAIGIAFAAALMLVWSLVLPVLGILYIAERLAR